jgi:hypothetical protein
VLFDFLKRLCEPCVYRHEVPRILAGDASPQPFFYQPDAHGSTVPALEHAEAPA